MLRRRDPVRFSSHPTPPGARRLWRDKRRWGFVLLAVAIPCVWLSPGCGARSDPPEMSGVGGNGAGGAGGAGGFGGMAPDAKPDVPGDVSKDVPIDVPVGMSQGVPVDWP